MNGTCPDCEYARIERAGIHMTHGGLSADEADRLAASERCAAHQGRPELRISVHNISERLKGDYEYVGRGREGKLERRLGNPFVIGPDGSRADVIRKYRVKLNGHIKLRDEVWAKLVKLLAVARTAEGLRLVCHCKPLACHADVITSALHFIDREGMA